MDFLTIPLELVNNLPLVWTFFLLLTRFTGLFLFIPGLGFGIQGLTIRIPALIVLAFSSLKSSQLAVIPDNMALLAGQIISELSFGIMLGVIPYLMITAIQTAAQLASTTMGLNASNLIDPTLGASSTDLSRIFGDVVIVMFLMIGGHHVIIQAASGYGSEITPGTYFIGEASLGVFIDRFGRVFMLGMLLSSPVVVALLLTQFVMGLISRAVPTINIFIISFPLTIGIGLILSILAFPEIMIVMQRELTGIEGSVEAVLQDFR